MSARSRFRLLNRKFSQMDANSVGSCPCYFPVTVGITDGPGESESSSVILKYPNSIHPCDPCHPWAKK